MICFACFIYEHSFFIRIFTSSAGCVYTMMCAFPPAVFPSIRRSYRTLSRKRTVLLHIVACRQKTCIQSSCCPEMFHCFHMLSFHFQNDSQKIMRNCTVRIFLHVLWNQLFTLTDASALYIFSDLSAKLLQFSNSVLSLFFYPFL